MPRLVRSARGEIVDFDLILIKNQLAQAPQNIEVARRQQFIDSKEGGKQPKPVPQAVVLPDSIPPVELSSPTSFEVEEPPATMSARVEPPAPPAIKRK